MSAPTAFSRHSITTQNTEAATATNQRFGTPRIRVAGSAGSVLATTMPMIAKLKLISMLRPISSTKAESAGAAQTGAYWVKWKTSAFQISLNQSMPKSASPAKTTFQFRRSISLA